MRSHTLFNQEMLHSSEDSTKDLGCEMELWRNVIGQAIKDYQKDPNSNANFYVKSRLIARKRSAGNWLYRSESNCIGSLSWICANLGVSKTYVRRIAQDNYNRLKNCVD
jgi:hypothetical protein